MTAHFLTSPQKILRILKYFLKCGMFVSSPISLMTDHYHPKFQFVIFLNPGHDFLKYIAPVTVTGWPQTLDAFASAVQILGFSDVCHHALYFPRIYYLYTHLVVRNGGTCLLCLYLENSAGNTVPEGDCST